MNNILDDCRVIDLTDERGFLCARMLGDLGADVIKVEPPGGAPSRNIGPFYLDEPHPEKSLYWFAYNASKRGVTLDIEAPAGRDVFRRLAERADIIVESFPAGYLDNIGFSYEALSKKNPGTILVSISPFGRTGPYRDFAAADLVAAGMGGEMYVTGEPDRPPLRISLPQAYLHAGAVAAVASLIAFYHARVTGVGQAVDVSICESVILYSATVAPFWYMLHQNLARSGVYREGTSGNAATRILWPCKDGYVMFSIMGTPSGARSNIKLMKLMDKEGLADALKSFNWDAFDRRTATQEVQRSVEDAVAPYISRHTREELLKAATDNGIMLLPVYSPKELLDYPQLLARDFWKPVRHPELNAEITYPGDPVKCSEAGFTVRRRAPLVGEHNEEVYVGELGYTRDELKTWQSAGII